MGEPLQVLFVRADGTFRVDSAALSRVTGEAAARGLPVCVVSVAGATRGGKSFLLDFFLRYLRAPDAARRSGAWIGADDEPLTGFSWSSGWDPNTSGILLWSEPVIVTKVVNGVSQQLAVLLMDTQGTFDSNTDVNVSTAIFAISTLMSSVQIYNLLQMINEDDLRHLQLFMEYGRLALNEGGSAPFQSLIFRIRDWQWPTRAPYGIVGGDQYLREVYRASALLREQIWPCFETVSCVLTPNPGEAVTEDSFNGLRDLAPVFKNSLLRIIPGILDPSKLVSKIINGNEVKIEELPVYFHEYIDLFNGGDLPPALGIFEATSRASVETAMVAARAAYTRCMEAACGGARRVARAAVPRLHAAACTRARDTFTARRVLSPPATRHTLLDALIRELDANLPHYVAVNNDKITTSIASCEAAYERRMDEATVLCTLPSELEEAHATARDAALTEFADSRATTSEDPPDADNGDVTALTRNLERTVLEYRERNSSRISRVCVEAREVYAARMRAARGSARALHAHTLLQAHQAATADALRAFHAHWPENGAINQYRNGLLEDMEQSYEELETSNNKENKKIADEALASYDSRMNEFCGSEPMCLHPVDLRVESGRARSAAIERLHAQRSASCRDCPDDSYKRRIELGVSHRYEKLVQCNDVLNRKAACTALRLYGSKMSPNRSFLGSIFPTRDFGVSNRHGPAKEAALNLFSSLRRDGPGHGSDVYLEKLLKDIQEDYHFYRKMADRGA